MKLHTYFPLILVLGFTNGAQIGKHSSGIKAAQSSPSHQVGIINGNETNITKYPFMASLTVYGSFFGSGAILNSHWILTTAFNVMWIPTDELQFRVGSTRSDKGGQTLQVDKVIAHENYTGSWDWDIAVVKLSKPIKFNKRAKKITLGTTDLKGGTRAIVAGWGETTSQGRTSTILHAADVTVLDWQTCSQTYPTDLTPRLLCTFDKNVGPCVYDYGDPLVIGTTVYGLYAGGHDCDPGTSPVLYTDIPSLYSWIKNAIKN